MSQIESEENFVNETLIISSMWKAPCDVFHNVVSSIWILHNGEHTLHTLQERKTPCPLRCEGAHPESSKYFCGVFRSKPLDERQEWVNASGFCRTCLRPQHGEDRCIVARCQNCKGDHSVMMCPVGARSNTPSLRVAPPTVRQPEESSGMMGPTPLHWHPDGEGS